MHGMFARASAAMIVLIGAILASQMVFGTAPYCVVDQTGTMANCIYFNLQTCQQLAQMQHGFCIANPNG
jgi:hypothetical protein